MERADSVFMYFYRDGGNFKTHGTLRLLGISENAEKTIRDCLEWSDQFVAEQVGIPSLCKLHWTSVGDGPSDLDHAYHEFSELRAMSEDEQGLPVWGSLETLVMRMQAAALRWDVSLSPNSEL